MLSTIAMLVPLLALWLWQPLWSRQRWKLAAVVVLLSILAGTSPALLIWAGRSDALSYDWVARLQILSGGAFVALIIAWLLAVLRDLVWGALRIAGSAKAQTWRSPRLTVGMALLATAIASYGVVQGVRVPEVRQQVVELPSLPPALNGLRIAVLSDIHASAVNNRAYVQALVERTMATNADMVVLPGDMVDGDARTQHVHLTPLSQLQAPLGVWAAPGNHEYYSGYNSWAHVFDTLGLRYLQNQTELLEVRGHRVAISGVGDLVYGRLSAHNEVPGVPEGVPPDPESVTTQAKQGGAEVHIVLGHQPKLAKAIAQAGADLQIAGHTHGGHIRGMDQWLVAPANAGYVRGLYEVGNMRLFVSSGAGLWAGFAIRLGVPSAIDVLELRTPSNPIH